MFDSDYYPAGAANDPRAPYNQVDIPYVEFELQLAHTFHIEPEIESDDYGGYDGDEYYNGNAVDDYTDQYMDVQAAMQEAIKLMLDRCEILRQYGIKKVPRGTIWRNRDIQHKYEYYRRCINTLELYADCDTEIEEE